MTWVFFCLHIVFQWVLYKAIFQKSSEISLNMFIFVLGLQITSIFKANWGKLYLLILIHSVYLELFPPTHLTLWLSSPKDFSTLLRIKTFSFIIISLQPLPQSNQGSHPTHGYFISSNDSEKRYINRNTDRWKQTEKNIKLAEFWCTCSLLFWMYDIFHFEQVMINIFTSETIFSSSFFYVHWHKMESLLFIHLWQPLFFKKLFLNCPTHGQ